MQEILFQSHNWTLLHTVQHCEMRCRRGAGHGARDAGHGARDAGRGVTASGKCKKNAKMRGEMQLALFCIYGIILLCVQLLLKRVKNVFPGDLHM